MMPIVAFKRSTHYECSFFVGSFIKQYKFDTVHILAKLSVYLSDGD